MFHSNITRHPPRELHPVQHALSNVKRKLILRLGHAFPQRSDAALCRSCGLGGRRKESAVVFEAADDEDKGGGRVDAQTPFDKANTA